MSDSLQPPWTAACQASLSITNSQSLLKLMFIESVMPSNHLILCHPLLLLPSISPSIRVLSNELVLYIKWPKYWSFNFSISPSNEYSGLISFRIAWSDHFAVQGTLKSLLQHHSSKASILQCSVYGPTLTSIHDYCKNHSFDSMDLCCQIMSLLFNKLSRFVKGFLSRTKCLSISWLHSPSAVILEPKNINSVTLSIVSLRICHEVMGLDAIIFVFQMLSFKPAFSLSYFTLIKRLFSFSFLSAIRIVSSASEVVDISSRILIPVCVSSNLAFCVIYFAYN